MSDIKVFKNGFLNNNSVLNISSVFGVVRKDNKKHHGIDIALPVGSRIYAPLSGSIIKVTTQKNSAGLYFILRHRINSSLFIDIFFMHLSKHEVKIGQNVKEGDFLALTGGDSKDQPNAGSSTGPHLHLEIRKNGTIPINPIPFLYYSKCIELKTGNILNWNTSFEQGDSDMYFSEDNLQNVSECTVSVDNTDYNCAEIQVKEEKTTTVANERLANGIWQIVKLLVDSSVEKKQVSDSGISSSQGSILNFFNKVCQEPMVEFMGDTFGNQYYLIARRPPFDKDGFKRMLDLTTTVLNSDSIISENLVWNNQNIYSWYQYLPYADLLGMKESHLFIPAVFFPEYAAIWGSKPLSIQSNYFNFLNSGRFNDNKEENKNNKESIMKNAIEDFKYIIQSFAYLPFTRRGTITIVGGDSRIKRGTLILHTTGEVFYVDNVTNSFEKGINSDIRITTLTVSRGIFPEYIDGKWIRGKKYSYFGLIRYDAYGDAINAETFPYALSTWRVDINTFNFFLRKEQVLNKKFD